MAAMARGAIAIVKADVMNVRGGLRRERPPCRMVKLEIAPEFFTSTRSGSASDCSRAPDSAQI
jgi:hypothetical protein